MCYCRVASRPTFPSLVPPVSARTDKLTAPAITLRPLPDPQPFKIQTWQDSSGVPMMLQTSPAPSAPILVRKAIVRWRESNPPPALN